MKYVCLGFNLLGFLLLLTACSSVKEVSSLENLKKSDCFNQSDYNYSVGEMPQSAEIRNIESDLSQNFSFESLNIANAFGFLNLLKDFNAFRNNHLKNPSIENQLKLIDLKLTILQKINNASLEISAVTSELDCEEERASQIANFLKGKVEKKERNLVIASMIVGAAGAITTEGFNNSPSTGKAGSLVAIGTAITEATLGVLILTNNKNIEFCHKRNTLGEIWSGFPTSKTLPSSIWYYLNYQDEENRKTSLRDMLMKHWENFGQIEKRAKNKPNKVDEIYFGNGGKYTFNQLENRADMYDQIESYIYLMKQDLNRLSVEFENFSLKSDSK